MRHVRFRDPAGSVRRGEWHDGHVSFAGNTYELDEIDVLPPSDPTKIVCVGLNYANHARRGGYGIARPAAAVPEAAEQRRQSR